MSVPDFSAAFDTIDHGIMLQRLSERFGVQGDALKWIQSYISDHEQYVCIDGSSSERSPLSYGVPQGSVLGPFLFCTYSTPLAEVFHRYGIPYQIYADDTKFYISMSADDTDEVDRSILKAQHCARDVLVWMIENWLKNNTDKIEIAVFGTRQQLAKIKLDEIELLDNRVNVNRKVKDLGVIFESDMSMNSQITHMCQSASYHLRNVKTVSRFLPKETVQTAVHSNVISRLDTGNSLLAGICKCRKLPDSVTCGCKIQRLQHIQNNAARVVQKAWRQDHITPVLYELHWLPVTQRVQYKILTIVFKCLHGMAPRYLTELIHVYQPSRSLH